MYRQTDFKQASVKATQLASELDTQQFLIWYAT